MKRFGGMHARAWPHMRLLPECPFSLERPYREYWQLYYPWPRGPAKSADGVVKGWLHIPLQLSHLFPLPHDEQLDGLLVPVAARRTARRASRRGSDIVQASLLKLHLNRQDAFEIIRRRVDARAPASRVAI